MKNVIYSLILVGVIMISTQIFAHGGGHEKKEETKAPVEVFENVEAPLDDFPTLHPLVVHFPIVLLLIAVASQLASMFVFKKELSWVTLFLLVGGFIGAYAASNFVHPHTATLSPFTQQVLEEHEEFAYLTVWIAGIAFVLKAISHFFLKRNIIGEAVVTILLIGSAYTVSTAGHYGAQLTHVETVGYEDESAEEGDHH